MVDPITSTVKSGPYRITVAGNDVWFTERNANRVGRLNATTGQLDEFYGHGLSLNAGLTDIKVAPNRTVWIGGQTAQRLIRLTVNSPSVLLTEYTDTARPQALWLPRRFWRLSDDLVGMTMPEAANRMALYDPGAQSFAPWPSLPAGATPYGIALTPGLVWYADPGRDKLGQIEIGTFTIVNEYGPITDALEITAESAKILWLTQQSGQAAIGRFTYTNTASTRFDSFALPVSKLRLTGIAAVPVSGVWSVAYLPEIVYLPLMLK
jgi:streptogramin lyase